MLYAKQFTPDPESNQPDLFVVSLSSIELCHQSPLLRLFFVMFLINAHLLRLKSGDLAGELEEASLDLETSRRKLTTLRSQDSMLSGPPTPSATPTGKKFEFLDGVVGPDKLSKQARELEAGLEEAKVSSTQRLHQYGPFSTL